MLLPNEPYLRQIRQVKHTAISEVALRNTGPGQGRWLYSGQLESFLPVSGTPPRPP